MSSAMTDKGSSLRPAVPERVRTLDASTLSARIDGFLASRGITSDAVVVVRDGRDTFPGPASPSPVASAPTASSAPERPGGATPAPPPPPEVQNTGPAVDFVCEDDVRQAMRTGRRIRLAERAIVTPAARDLGDANDVFVVT